MSLGPCACMGPMYGEPLCYCRMVEAGLPLNEEARETERLRAEAQWAEFVKNNPHWPGENPNE